MGTCGSLTVSFIYTEAPRYDTVSSERFPNGAMLQLVVHGRRQPLVPSFAASAGACVSFDGKRVLFSGKQKPNDPWQIWEMALAGGVPRRLTSGSRDAITPFYVPPDRVVYAAGTERGFQIEIMPLDRSIEPLRLTYAPGDHIIDDVLLDGRILFEAPHARSAPKARDLYTVYSNGSGVETYRCDHGHDRRGGRQLSSGDILFDTSGQPAKFTSARAVEVPVAAARGDFAGPAAGLPGGEFLIAYRPAANTPFDLVRWKPGVNPPQQEIAAAGRNSVEPVLAAPRAIPKIHPTGLGDRDGANLLCLNVYTTSEKIAPGSVSAVRVSTLDDRRVVVPLGMAPVERDGSFFVQTPSERPIRFELLGRAALSWPPKGLVLGTPR